MPMLTSDETPSVHVARGASSVLMPMLTSDATPLERGNAYARAAMPMLASDETPRASEQRVASRE